ncbi:membrane protein insertion efficiency factor YidD [Patescibacteria group bacterium]|nr:membrane protein insertion efficiency factor YidD [Patescibacteria group bacterium]
MNTHASTLSSTSAIAAITLYQRLLQPFIKICLLIFIGHYSQCKHDPTCSQYTINQIRRHGTIQGLKKGIVRIWNCR